MLGFVAATLALAIVGCADDELVENAEPLPAAYDDPNSTNLTDGDGWGDGSATDGKLAGGAEDWNKGANDGSLGPDSQAGKWSPVDPDNNLGFPIIYFGYDADTLSPNEARKLDGIASYLSEQAALGLIVEGHCDQRGTEEYNRGLGERRANSIRTYLNGKGIADERIKTLSFGEDRPVSNGENNESAWAKDRRGVLIPANIN